MIPHTNGRPNTRFIRPDFKANFQVTGMKPPIQLTSVTMFEVPEEPPLPYSYGVAEVHNFLRLPQYKKRSWREILHRVPKSIDESSMPITKSNVYDRILRPLEGRHNTPSTPTTWSFTVSITPFEPVHEGWMAVIDASLPDGTSAHSPLWFFPDTMLFVYETGPYYHYIFDALESVFEYRLDRQYIFVKEFQHNRRKYYDWLLTWEKVTRVMALRDGFLDLIDPNGLCLPSQLPDLMDFTIIRAEGRVVDCDVKFYENEFSIGRILDADEVSFFIRLFFDPIR
jgi:hypothetical protein